MTQTAEQIVGAPLSEAEPWLVVVGIGDEGWAGLGPRARAAVERRRSLQNEREAAHAAVADARDALRDAYAELKRFEISLSEKIVVDRRNRARREQADLDELSSRLLQRDSLVRL